MEPLNIAIDGLALDSIISAEGYDPITLADAIVSSAVTKLTHEDEWRETYNGLKKRIAAIRDEEIRAVVKHELESVMDGPVTMTNQWGEPTGQPTTVLGLIMKHAERFFTEKSGDYNRAQTTAAQRVVAEMVDKAMTKELAAAVADEKTKVVAAIRAKAADLIAQAVKEGVGR